MEEPREGAVLKTTPAAIMSLKPLPNPQAAGSVTAVVYGCILTGSCRARWLVRNLSSRCTNDCAWRATVSPSDACGMLFVQQAATACFSRPTESQWRFVSRNAAEMPRPPALAPDPMHTARSKFAGDNTPELGAKSFCCERMPICMTNARYGRIQMWD